MKLKSSFQEMMDLVERFADVNRENRKALLQARDNVQRLMDTLAQDKDLAAALLRKLDKLLSMGE